MTAEMTATLPSAAEAAGDGCAVILSLGARGARVPSLLNSALGTTLPTPETRASTKGDVVSTPTAPLVAAAAPADVGVLVVNVHGLDSRNRNVADAVDGALHVGMSIAGVVLLAIRLPDLARSASSGIDAFFTALEKNLHHRVSGVASRIPVKRMIIVAVRDFEVEEVTEEELRECVMQQFETGYGRILKPETYARKAFHDLFDVRFCLFPNDKVHPAKFEERVKELAVLLSEDAVREFADAGNTAASIVSCAEKTTESMNGELGRNLPADRELAGTFTCASVLQSAVERFRGTTMQWKATVDSGRIIRDFGAESSKLISRTLEVYESDCAAFASTNAFARKKDELKNILLADAYVLYAIQILKLREVAYQIFRGNLGRIRITDKVDKSIKGAVRQAELYFIEKAESLRCPLSNWRFENERYELVNHMREDATERLQLARLQGNYVPPIRAPVAFAFHTLLPSPFGQDSRSVHPHAEEMQQKFDPDKIKKADLMRSRPYPTKHKIRVQPIPHGAMDIYDDIFVNSEK